MKCETVTRLLTEDASTANREEVRRHLDACESCRELYRDLLAMGQLVDSVKGDVKAPLDFRAKVSEKVLREVSRSWRPHWSLSATLVTVLLVTAGIVSLSQMASEGIPRDPSVSAKSSSPSGELERLLPQDFVVPVAGGVQLRPETHFSGHYVDVMADSPQGGYVLRLPEKIEIRRMESHHEFYFNDLSH